MSQIKYTHFNLGKNTVQAIFAIHVKKRYYNTVQGEFMSKDIKTEIDKEDYTAPKAGDPLPVIKKGDKVSAHTYSRKELIFIETYIETLDKAQALKAASMSSRQLENNKYLQEECLKLQRIIQKKHRLKIAGAKHIALMEKFEDTFDKAVESKDAKTQVGMSSTLARMSEAAMRASGEFKDAEQAHGAQIQVNINIGGNEEEVAPTIEGEATEVKINTGDKD